MNSKRVLIILLALFAALGFALAYLAGREIPEPKPMQLGTTLLFSILTFAWFWFDSEARSYKRSPFLNVAVVGLGALAIPYYLLRSRPKGQRLKSIGKFIGFILLLIAALVLGGFPGAWLSMVGS